MARYEDASVQAYVSLAVLNAGQATIFTIGLAICMVMCAMGIQDGRNTVGDFVMINAMMIQLYQPLNFMGMVYREIKQAVIDIETMFAILARKPEIEDRPGAPPLAVKRGAIRFENVSFAHEPARPQALRRRETAGGDCAHDPEGAADPGARRGDLRARQPYREGNPGRARPRVTQPDHARDRASALDHRRC